MGTVDNEWKRLAMNEHGMTDRLDIHGTDWIWMGTDWNLWDWMITDENERERTHGIG